jgi:folylpolyglutamate synthase/dihydrofolate synthase
MNTLRMISLDLFAYLLSREDIVRLGSQVINEMKDFSWTVFFDLFLAMAIKYFNEHNPDYVLLETGIGGRFDSTNFVDSPAACVITSISLDHQSMLGDTTEQIAWQKAGITKPGSAVFTASSQEAGVLAVFKRECEDKGACLHVVPVSRDEVQHFRVAAQYDTQTENLCVSAAVLTHLGIPLTPHTFQSFFWPCRMEVFPVRSQGRSVDVVVDGCHNLHRYYTILLTLIVMADLLIVWSCFLRDYEAVILVPRSGCCSAAGLTRTLPQC